VTALDDRRQVAREAGLDACDDEGRALIDESDRLDVAIETATRVRITREMLDAGMDATEGAVPNYGDASVLIKAALAAAGFEVEE